MIGVGDVAAQTEKCIDNLRTVLAEVGGTLADIVAMTIYFPRREDIPGIPPDRFTPPA